MLIFYITLLKYLLVLPLVHMAIVLEMAHIFPIKCRYFNDAKFLHVLWNEYLRICIMFLSRFTLIWKFFFPPPKLNIWPRQVIHGICELANNCFLKYSLFVHLATVVHLTLSKLSIFTCIFGDTSKANTKLRKR